MINSVLDTNKYNFRWVDVLAPTEEDFQKLAEEFKLHPAYVKDCMEPFHLPKIEFIDEGTIFIITRVYDESAQEGAETVQELTNKIALFITKDAIISIHRADEPFIVKIREKWLAKTKIKRDSKDHLFNELLDEIIKTYYNALGRSNEIIDRFDQRIFKNSKDSGIIRELYEAKRMASVYKRMLFLTKDIIYKYAKRSGKESPFDKDLIEAVDKSYFLADDLHENVNNLLNLHISLASHRTNEVMGVLTIFSVFFLPLTFIVGLYGMNFDFMPELHYKYAYPAVWVVMVLSAFATYWMFKKRGWL